MGNLPCGLVTIRARKTKTGLTGDRLRLAGVCPRLPGDVLPKDDRHGHAIFSHDSFVSS